jgi:glycine/D-amino acid oxidase-like deaminating enzyme
MRVAILGAGIMGSCLALQLSRRGVSVTLIDKEAAPAACASRWNEGKIHLGYLYGADPSLATARHMLPGSLLFSDLLQEVIDADPRRRATTSDDIFVVHRKSVTTPDALEALFCRIDELVSAHPDAGRYLADASTARHRRLGRDEVSAISGSDDIVAGFAVPERSIDTQWVADRLVDAVSATGGIELRLNTRVLGAEPVDLPGGAWRVRTDRGDEAFDLVVNTLWEGRLAVDATAGLPMPADWSHRYRLCLFVRTATHLDVPSTLICVGGFGDVKNYGGRDFYMSWYPVGLVATGREVAPPPRPVELGPDEEVRFVEGVRANLTRLLPATEQIFSAASETRIKGGYVFAQEAGDLNDPHATIHRRDRFGVERNGNYLSVDTGKYSTAPFMARRVAQIIAG